MAIIETKVTFKSKGEQVKRLMRKNNKDRMARTIVDVYEKVFDPNLSPQEKVREIQQLTATSFWG